MHTFTDIRKDTHFSPFIYIIIRVVQADSKLQHKNKKCIEQLSWLCTRLSWLFLSWLCSNEDLQWTPQSPHSAADSQHSHFLQLLGGTLEKEGSSLHFFLSLSLAFPLYLPPSPSPPLIILHSRGVIVALCVHCLMLF